MSTIDWSLLIAAVLVSAASWRNPRAILWVVLAAVDFAISTVYWRSGLPYAEGVAGACDAAVCLGIYFAARQRWELWIWRLFQTSVAINFLYLAGNIGIFTPIDHEVYSSALEAINWLTLLLIGGMAGAQWIGASIASAHRPWSPRGVLHRTLMALRHQRRETPFHKAR